MKNFETACERNPARDPIISFYGGKPLLNFELMKNAVNYLKSNYSKYEDRFQFHTTTNGLILDDKIQDFLYENKFNVLVSIDGYKENHNRNRISAGGMPTFDKVYGNYIRFKKRYPNFPVFVSACYDFKTDMNRFDRFAKESDEKEIEVLRASLITNSDKYYSQFTQKDRELFAKNFQKMKDRFFEKAINKKFTKSEFLYKFFIDIYGSFSYHGMINEESPKIRPCTSTCVPGEKIYVESDGNFIICEKTNNKEKIGNVHQGLDCIKIAEIMQKYNKIMLKNCKKCNVTKVCTLCFKDFCSGKYFYFDNNICKNQISSVNQLSRDYINLLEQNPRLFEEITTDYYSHIEAARGAL